MAKRRVNKKFLVIVTVVVCTAVIAVGVVGLLNRKSASHYTAAAEAYAKQGRYEDAARSYGLAFGASSPHDPHLAILQAEMLRKSPDVDAQRQYIPALRRALEVDPNNTEALTRLVDVMSDYVRTAQ